MTIATVLGDQRQHLLIGEHSNLTVVLDKAHTTRKAIADHGRQHEDHCGNDDNAGPQDSLMPQIKEMPQVGGVQHERNQHRPSQRMAIQEHGVVRHHAQHHRQRQIIVVQ